MRIAFITGDEFLPALREKIKNAATLNFGSRTNKGLFGLPLGAAFRFLLHLPIFKKRRQERKNNRLRDARP